MSLHKSFGPSLIWYRPLLLQGSGYTLKRALTRLWPLLMPVAVFGSDIGLRLDARRGDTPVGRFVIRSDVNGQSVKRKVSKRDPSG